VGGLAKGCGGPGLVDRHVVGEERGAVHALERFEVSVRVGDGNRHVDAQVGAGCPSGVQELGAAALVIEAVVRLLVEAVVMNNR